MTHRARLPLLTLCLGLVLPQTASAYCPVTTYPWTTGATLPVRLHAQLDEQLRHTNNAVWSRTELENSVRYAITRINASSGADIPYLYLDTSQEQSTCDWYDDVCGVGPSPNVNVDCEIPGAIHIIPSRCEGPLHRVGASNTGGLIILKSSLNGRDPGLWPYEHFSIVDGSTSLIEHRLMHEIGHALGLGHPFECGDPSWSTSICPPGANSTCAIMDVTQFHQRTHEFYLPDDVNGLRALYGSPATPTERSFESSNLASGVTEWPMGNVSLEGFFSASSDPSLTPTSTTLVGYSRTASNRPLVYSWNWSDFSLTNLGTPPSSVSTNGPIEAAQSNTYRFIASSAFRLTSDSLRWHRRINASYRTLSGGTWTTLSSNPAPGTAGDTLTGGMGTTYDSTNGALIYAYRSTQGEILLQAGTSGTPFSTGVFSRGSPSIVCAPTGTYNCVVTVVEPGRAVTSESYTRLRWFSFKWSSATGFVMNPTGLITEPWIMWNADPQVSIYRLGSSYEYVVTYTQSINLTTYIWVLHKSLSASSFSFWGGLATSQSLRTGVANGSTRDLEIYMFSY